MPEKVRVFTVAEANALLPRLNVILERQMVLLGQIDAATEALRAQGLDPREAELNATDPPEAVSLKAQFKTLTQSFREGWTEVEALGAVVKDVRTGLLDFHGRRGGQLVWLCWKYGEPAVAHWHPLDQGFGARQPLERETIPPTLN